MTENCPCMKKKKGLEIDMLEGGLPVHLTLNRDQRNSSNNQAYHK